jgi:hypothetical protein
MNSLILVGDIETRSIPGFPGYFASEDGDIFSTKSGKTRRLKPSLRGDGYLSFVPSIGRKKYCIAVHRAVALAFIPNPHSLPQVNHIDGVKTNNQPSNLEWCTQSENRTHAKDTGLLRNCGKRSPLTDEQLKTVLSAYRRKTSGKWGAAEIAERFGVNHHTIYRAVRRAIRRAKELQWESA